MLSHEQTYASLLPHEFTRTICKEDSTVAEEQNVCVLPGAWGMV
jgi:hypothetical protein